jgi:polyhydroxyalkanoate synthesis regulator phasin
MHDDLGMRPIGLTDAEVTHAFIQWLMRRSKEIQHDSGRLEQRADMLEIELSKLRNAPKSKTKQRLAKLEEQVSEMQQRLERNCI